MDIIKNMDKIKEETNFLFENFFTLHKSVESERHDKKLNVNASSLTEKDLKSLAQINLPKFESDFKDLTKNLKRNNI